MHEDDRHLLTRFFAWVERKCPWVHIPLFIAAVAAMVKLTGWLLRMDTDEPLLPVVLTAGTLGCMAYLCYIVRLGASMLNALQPMHAVDVRIVGSRCETFPMYRGRDIELYYCAFKPLDGSPYIELRIPSELEYMHLAHGDVGTLRFRGRRYLSFVRTDAPTNEQGGDQHA